MEECTLVRAQKYPTLSELEHSEWRNEFPQRIRRRICNLIENMFSKNLRGNYLTTVLPKIANEFEATIFNHMAQSEADYLRKIVFKLFSIVSSLGCSSSMQNAHQINLANLETCTGNDNQGLDWQAETFEEIKYLKRTYGERFWDAYSWVKSGSQKKKRNIIGPSVLQSWIHGMKQIANMFLLTQKESISIEMKENICHIEKQILFYIDVKESFDSSEEIYSKLETSNPDKNQEFILNELIKAFLMDKAKKLDVYIHLADDEDVGYSISYSLQKEIVEIINEWCDHKIRILIQGQPTMQETENELSIWQTLGTNLQQWVLLKHLPMKVGPIRRHPDPMFETVCSIWKMLDTELRQQGQCQQHLYQQVSSAQQPAVQVPKKLGPIKKPDAIQHLCQQVSSAQQPAVQVPLKLGPIKKPDAIQKKSSLFQQFPREMEMDPTFQQYKLFSGSPLIQFHHYQGFPSQHMGTAQKQPMRV